MKQILFSLAMCIFGLSCMSCSPDDDNLPTDSGKETTSTSSSGTSSTNQSENNNGSNNEETNNKEETTMNRNITINVGGRSFAATLEDNETTRAFVALLPMTVTMTEMNGNEKYYSLSQDLPTNTYRPGTIYNGDLLLWGSSTIVLFYETFSSSYSYTRLGKIDNPDGLAAAVGSGNVSVEFRQDS